MVEINIYFICDLDKENINSATLLKSNWFSPNYGDKGKRFLEKTNKAIIKKGKKLAKENKILKDISAVVTSTNFSKIGGSPHRYATVDFYTYLTPKMRYLNPQS